MNLKNIGKSELELHFNFYFDYALVSREAVAYSFNELCKSSFKSENLCKCRAEALGYDFFAFAFIPEIVVNAAAGIGVPFNSADAV